MNQFEKMLEEKQKELGVVFPDSCRQALAKKPPSKIVTQWTLREPRRWDRLQTTIGHLPESISDAACAVSIGDDGCGTVYFLRTIPNSTTQIGDQIYAWDHETHEVTQVGDSLLNPSRFRSLLREANQMLGDDLEIVDEEDTY